MLLHGVTNMCELNNTIQMFPFFETQKDNNELRILDSPNTVAVYEMVIDKFDKECCLRI